MIRNKAQLIDPGVCRAVSKGPILPIPGDLAAAVQAADAHENSTVDSFFYSTSSRVSVVLRKVYHFLTLLFAFIAHYAYK